MTYDEIKSLPDRELDFAVAKARGYTVARSSVDDERWELVNPDGTSYSLIFETPEQAWTECKSYSTKIADAWEVFIDGLSLTGNATITTDMEHYGRGTLDVAVEIGKWSVFGPVCRSICRAFLLNATDGVPS